MSVSDREHWARVAGQWIEWAGRPGHDAFWAYRRALADYLGPGSGAALDLGCGEGRISRELKKLGWRVTASDAVAEMVEAARAADSADEYLVAEAGSLPLADESFDLVMAYNLLMDVDDLDSALTEAGRVLKPGGTLFISLVHPFRDRGHFTGPEPGAAFIVPGSYYGLEYFSEEIEEQGLPMHFAGWSRPLEDYMAALERAGLAVVSLKEPQPDVAAAPRLAQWSRIPLFLWLKAARYLKPR